LNGAVQRGDKAADHPKAEIEAGNPQPATMQPHPEERLSLLLHRTLINCDKQTAALATAVRFVV